MNLRKNSDAWKFRWELKLDLNTLTKMNADTKDIYQNVSYLKIVWLGGADIIIWPYSKGLFFRTVPCKPIKDTIYCLSVLTYEWMVFYDPILHGRALLGRIQSVIMRSFGMDHAPDAGLIARPVDLQSCALPLWNWYPLMVLITVLVLGVTYYIINEPNTMNRVILSYF